MEKNEAIELIDAHKNKLVNPVEMLHWTWLRVILSNIPDKDWDKALQRAHTTLAQ